MAQPTDLDAVARIAITMYGGGAMAVSGNIGDVTLALAMLDHARDAVRNQLQRRDKDGLMIPPRDVVVPVNDAYPLTQNADVAPELRMGNKAKPLPEYTGLLRDTASPYKAGPYTRLAG